jgi:CrcB protein
MMSWSAWICVALGGALGAVTRVALVSQFGAKHSPWGVALANVVGTFCFAIVLGVAARPLVVALPVKAFFLSGFLGAFTTFSTFTFEAWQFLQHGAWASFTLYLSVNFVGSLLAFFLGLWLIGYPQS